MKRSLSSFGARPPGSGKVSVSSAFAARGLAEILGTAQYPGLYNFKPTNLKKWRKALARVRSEEADAKLLFGPGNSTTFGSGASGTSDVTRWRKSYPHFASQLLAASTGLVANRHSVFPLSAIASEDGRVAHTGLTVSASGWQFTTAGGTLTFTPDGPVDTFRIWYFNSAANALGFRVDAGATTNNLSSAANPVSTTITTTLGTHTLTVTQLANSPWVRMVEAWDSTKKHIKCWNVGQPGATVDTFNGAPTSGWLPKYFIPGQLQPDLSIIDLDINDATAATDLATYRSKYEGIVDYCQLSGDVILMLGVPWVRADMTAAARYQAVVSDIARVRDLPLISLPDRWISRDDANALGFVSDASGHPSFSGYADIGQLVAKALLI